MVSMIIKVAKVKQLKDPERIRAEYEEERKES